VFGEEPVGGVKIFPLLLGLFINVNSIAAIQRKETEIAKFLPIGAEQFCDVFY
jgi:hypothetical protein